MVEADEDADTTPIEGYYCTCASGARTLGTCANVTNVMWYLGYARHEENIRYPSTALLNSVQDAGHRPPDVNPYNARVIRYSLSLCWTN